MFRDTSMDYLSRDEVLEIWNNNMRLTDEQLLAMDETEFRARVRERSHHTLEIQVYATAYRHQKFRDLRPRKSHRPDLPSVPTGSTGGSEYPTFTGRYLLGSRWTAFFLLKETH